MAFGDSDLPRLVGGLFSVAVSFGATNTRGILDYHDLLEFDEEGQARVVGRSRGVTLQTSEVAALANGTAITVDGGSYAVRGQPMALDDGALSLVYLRG